MRKRNSTVSETNQPRRSNGRPTDRQHANYQCLDETDTNTVVNEMEQERDNTLKDKTSVWITDDWTTHAESIETFYCIAIRCRPRNVYRSSHLFSFALIVSILIQIAVGRKHVASHAYPARL